MLQSLVSYVIAALIGALAVVIYTFDERLSLAPDSVYYKALGAGQRVPTPFCGRWLIPRLFRGHGYWYLYMAPIMSMLVSVSIYRLTGTYAACVLLLALPHVRFAVRHPILVDWPAIALPVIAAAWVPDYWYLVLPAALVIGAAREWSVIWYAVLAQQPLALLGLAGAGWGYYRWRRPAQEGTDNPFITRPVQTVSEFRRGQVFNWKLMLLPWGMVLPLALLAAGSSFPWYWFALAYLPLVTATDHGRIFLLAAPVFIVLAVSAPLPAGVWGFALLVHVFNPYRGG